MSKAQVNTRNPTTEVQLPPGWWWSTVGDVADDTQIGIVRSKAQQNRAGKGVPYLKMNNLTMDGKVTADDIVFVEATQGEIDRFSVRAGDILFNTRNSVELVGKTGIVTGEASGSIYNNNLMRIRTKPDVSSLFVAYQMCSPDFRRRMERVKRSTTNVAALYAKDVLPLPLALSSIDQQKRIVAEIEKHFSRLDEAVANLKRVKANLKRYKAAVLKAAVEGKLTEDWRKAHLHLEPASELLKRILAERRAKWNGKGKYDEPISPDVKNLPDVPEKWIWCRTDQLFQFVTSGSRGWAKYYSPNGAVFLRIGNLDHDSIALDLSDIQRVSPPDGAEGTRTRIQVDDILISITADVGMIAVVPRYFEEAYINQHISLARPVGGFNVRYLAWYLAARPGQKQFLELQRGATKAGLGLEDVRSVNVPMPPLTEQLQIVSEIESRFSVVAAFHSQLTDGFKRVERLRQSILKGGFSGHLSSACANTTCELTVQTSR